MHTPQRLYGLDHLRALAILLVFMFHYRLPFFQHPNWVTNYAKFGWTGVDLFFVLSGFLIASHLLSQTHAGQTISFKNFFIKRTFRIMPAYWLTLLIYFAIPSFHEREALPPLYKYLTFTQNFGMDVANLGTFSHAWSLCVEEHFYLFLPLTLILLQNLKAIKYGAYILITLFIAGFFIRHYNWTHFFQPRAGSQEAGIIWYRHIYYPTHNRLDGLLAGVLIAAIKQYKPILWNKFSAHSTTVLLLALAALTGAYFLCEDPMTYSASVFGFPLVALGYGLLVISALSPESPLYKTKSRITTFIALTSYSVYLTHKGVTHLTQTTLQNFGIDTTNNTTLIISLAVCFAAAYLVYLLVEKPFIKWRDKLM